MLPLLLLLGQMVVLNATGPLFFDGNAIAYVHLNGTEAAIFLPLLPGEHIVQYGGQDYTWSLFDIVCETEGTFSCNVTAYDAVELPYQISCGNIRTGTLSLSKDEIKTISAGGVCNTAELRIGDYSTTLAFTQVFTNYMILEDGQELRVWQGDELVLEKFGSEYIGFPELDPGEYKVIAGPTYGKLIVEEVETSTYGIILSVLLVIAAISLLWVG
ncbi:MAG: hypothetical protein GOV01_03130 [Candidatus Altiarchaeota archaeon]|nr:hypothetical protein [Candidatus Altiarchaeota archaeon]